MQVPAASVSLAFASDTIGHVSSTMTTTPPALLSLLPDPKYPSPRRADLLSIKLKLAALLPPDEGQEYWQALVDFVTGKINRIELGNVMKRCLGTSGEAIRLHNALVLSILYNTTRPTLTPLSVRHSGWHKRQRDKNGFALQDRDPKRRRIKAAVMAIGKRERAELKMLNSAASAAVLANEKRKDAHGGASGKDMLSASFGSRGGKVGTDGLPVALLDAKSPSATLQQDYMRCLQTPWCGESKILPDVDSLRDRMSLIAYEGGLGGGADFKAAALGVQAIENHLVTMITSVISLIRLDRANGVQTSSNTVLRHLNTSATSTSLKADAVGMNTVTDTDKASCPPASATTPSIVISNSQSKDVHLQTSPEAMTEELQGGSRPNGDSETLPSPDSAFLSGAPPKQHPALSIGDFTSLFEISPHLLGLPHLGSVEKMYACPILSDDSSDEYSSCSSDDERQISQASAEAGPSGVGGKSVSRNASGSRSSRSNTVNGPRRANSTGGREQYLIDPTAITGIPLGHPDVRHHPRVGGLGLPSPSSNISTHLAPNLAQSANGASTFSQEAAERVSAAAAVSTLRKGSASGSRPGSSVPLPSQTAAEANGGVTGATIVSPKTQHLRNQLFPELEAGGAGEGREPHPNGVNAASLANGGDSRASPMPNGHNLPHHQTSAENYTSTDGGTDSDDPAILSNRGRRLGSTGEAMIPPGGANGRGRNGNNSSNGSGRKLWDVVDSVRLLDGVLD